MKNLIARVPGSGNQIIVLGSHYDTKFSSNFLFVGANDGGSSTGLLLELARVIPRTKRKEAVWLVFFDGEEAQQEWTEQDSLYGSRYFVESLRSQGLVQTVKAMILMDMVGDKDLVLERDQASTPWLVDLVWKAARELGYGTHLASSRKSMTDDHVPFIEAGIPAVDLIDFDYGFFNRYWHSASDTLDKISPRSLKIVGDIVLQVLEKLSQPTGEHGPPRRSSSGQ
jgi:Zn-dependent M28 family amino/carboxypeptidase